MAVGSMNGTTVLIIELDRGFITYIHFEVRHTQMNQVQFGI